MSIRQPFRRVVSLSLSLSCFSSIIERAEKHVFVFSNPGTDPCERAAAESSLARSKRVRVTPLPVLNEVDRLQLRITNRHTSFYSSVRFNASRSIRRDTTKADILENRPSRWGILEGPRPFFLLPLLVIYITRLRPFRRNGIHGWIGSRGFDSIERENWGEQVGGMAVGHRSKMPRGEIIVGESERSSADSYLLLFVYRFNLF